MAAFGDHPSLPKELGEILEDETTSTVFLKADCPPRAKRGHISELKLEDIGKKPWTKAMVSELSDQMSVLVEQHSERSDCFVEIEREGCRILQVGDLRVTCAWPPFSDAWEITVVRPVAYLSLSDYDIDPELKRRLSDHHLSLIHI